MAKKSHTGRLVGDLSLLMASKQSFAAAQIELLQAVADCGSITAAARQVGISYKTAWDRIDAMNNMSKQPLVHRVAGGAQGGGTRLTELGQRIIGGFQALQREHEKFIERVGSDLHSLSDIASFIRSESMSSSARNQFRGKIIQVVPGAVNAEVELDIGTNQILVAIVTQDSVERLALAEHTEVVALIKASSVLISSDTQVATSARNKLVGKVSRLQVGAVNTDITLDIGAGKSVSAIITNASATALGLSEGSQACAIFKAPSVILLKDD
ncbi:MAG: TOBE domain-containing protein [Parahaliea sp.]